MVGVFYLKNNYYICIMVNRSTHYGDIQKWIEKVIDSCETYEQTLSARKLVWNFEKQMVRNKVDSGMLYTIRHYLRNMVSSKVREIQGKYLES
jgi:hypothetical protein